MRRRYVALFVGLAASAPSALASEEAHRHGGEIPFLSLLFSTINLLIFLWIMSRFVYPSVRDWVRERRARVEDALREAAAARAEADRLRAEFERRLGEIDRTIEELRAQARQDAEREREHILEAARKAADTITRDAERAAAYEVRRTEHLLRAQLVHHAIRLAEEATRAQWSPSDQQRFVADFLKRVRQ
jgi:F-type H+-transporting ATPase subunit b